MEKTLKIGLACFIGGITTTGIALLVAPAFWWLGLIAGFPAGYLAYEFREVVRAVPPAFKASAEAMGVFGGVFRIWVAKPHPVL